MAGRTLVHRRNCVGCHIIEDDGGDFLKLVADSSLGPPLLTPEGARVQPDWLYAFLRGPIQIRPWLDVRMPTFGLDDANLNSVIHYFQAINNNAGAVPDLRRRDDGESRRARRCSRSCSARSATSSARFRRISRRANLAPDLRMAHDRLNPDWMLPWLKNPASFLPGTRMTQFWPDYPKSPYPELGGDAEAQMRAIIAASAVAAGRADAAEAGSSATAATN